MTSTLNTMRCRKVKGFTLVAALLLLVVLAPLSAYMVNLNSVQHTAVVYGLQGARAMQAARAGIAWGVFNALDGDVCPSSLPFSSNGAGKMDDFTIQVNCNRTIHDEGVTSVAVYELTSTANIGSYGTLDFVSRKLQISISNRSP